MKTTRITPRHGAWRYGKRAAKWLLTGAFVLWSGVAPAWAAPTPEQMLQFKPRQEGVAISTPTDEASIKACKVNLAKGAGKGSGWVLKDAQGNVLRNFFDSNGDNKIDIWSYYKDGKEVYREVDTTFTGAPDQYRWLNDGGSKWGVNEKKEGKIKHWKAISVEEVSQEIVAALVGKDYARLQVLMITEAEMVALGMSPTEIARIRNIQQAAPAEFNKTIGKMPKLNTASTWQNLTTNNGPSCIPSEVAGGRTDIIKQTHATIVIEVNDKEKSTEMLLPGEMIQVGATWRIVGAPTPVGEKKDEGNAELDALLLELGKIDNEKDTSAAHHLKRADVLEKIIAVVKETDRETWIRQVADSLSSAAQGTPAAGNQAQARLSRLVDQIVKAMPAGSNLAGYVTFRQLQAEYSLKISDPKAKFEQIQADWIQELTKFVTAYPKAEDTPDALLQLGMVNEFLNKDVEAKNWYKNLARDFTGTKQAEKADGAIRRLEMEGKPFTLAGPTLSDPKVAFNIGQLHDKVVIVYYWASWNSQSVGDFAKLKLVLGSSKEVELLTVNLDNSVEEARAFLTKSPAPGTHLYGAGGLEGKLATDYGVMLLPNVFLIGKDGKCLNRAVQIPTVEEEIKKAVEKK